LILDGQTSTVSALLDAFPPKERAAPELILVRAGVEIVRGSLDDAAGYLAVADREAEKVPVERRSAYDLESLVARLTLARRRGDLAGVHSAGAALPELSDVPTSGAVELNNDARAVALFELGIAELWTLNLADAKRHLDDGLSLARRINRPFLEVGCLGYLALIAGTKSLPRQRELATQAVAVADAHGWGTDPIVTMPLATLAIASAGQGRFDEGRQWLDRTRAALPPDAEPLAAMYADLADAVLLICERNFEAAADWLQDALAVETRLVMRSVIGRQVRQLLVIALIRLGRVDEARRWIAQFADDDRGSAEFGVALANLKLAEADARGALDALAGTLDGSATAIGDGTRIQAEMLAAIACDRLGDARAAQEHIERALDLAEPSTWVFPFLITDALDLIERQPRHATAHAALLADLIDLLSNGPGASLAPRADQPLEKLTDSELRVLRFLPSNLSAPEIAGELFLSTSTVKTHMRHIYDKLGTHKRTDAVQRARQLGLLAGTTRRT